MFKNFKKISIGFVIFSIIFLIYANHVVGKSCDHWENGLVKKLDFSDEYCFIAKPSACWPDVIDGWFNFGADTCKIKIKDESQRQNQVLRLLQSYKIVDEYTPIEEQEDLVKNYKYLAWPLVNKFEKEKRNGEYRIINTINKRKKRYDNLEDAVKDGKEVVIDVQNQEMHLNVFRNETVVEERKQIIKENNIQSLADNVIVVYIDTVSRAQIYRKLKKFAAYLQKYADFNSTDYEEEERDKKAFEFFRYHSTDSRTFNNAFKLQYDVILDDVEAGRVNKDKDNQVKSFFTDFKEQGYITAHSTNTLSLKSVFRSYPDLHPFFQEQYCDHEFFNFDPQYINPYNIFNVGKGTNSIYRRCLYGKDTNYFPFDYGEKFLDTYKDEKKFLYLEFTDGHEITSEIVQYIDDNLTNFFESIEKKGHLEKSTAVYFLSDHGQHLLSAFQIFSSLSLSSSKKDVYSLERMLPFFYVMMTNDLLEKNKGLQETIEGNEQSIFTIGTFRQTLMGTAYGYQNKTAIQNSLLSPLQHDKSCLDIGMVQFPKPDMFCSCVPYKGFDDFQGYMDNYYD